MTALPSPPLLGLVAIGGSVGSLLRHLTIESTADDTMAVLALNVIGSLLIGTLTAWAGRPSGQSEQGSARWSALLGLGFCGGLTTFSTHMVDVATRFSDGMWRTGVTSLVVTSVLAIGAAAVGHQLAQRSMAGRRPTEVS